MLEDITRTYESLEYVKHKIWAIYKNSKDEKLQKLKNNIEESLQILEDLWLKYNK